MSGLINAQLDSTAALPSKKFIGAVEDQWELYSDEADDYTIGPPIGFGASSIVYQALYQPKNCHPPKQIPCALKVLDLDSLPPYSLSLLQRETTLMSLSKHDNVLRVRGSWMDGHKLHIALRLMNKGSAADIMHYGWPGGMEEDVIRCILKQALQGLNYLHINGFLHRDIKAANLLIDDDGTVLLGDLGVAADLSEDSSYPPKTRAAGPSVTNDAAFRSPIGESRPSTGSRRSSSDNVRHVRLVEPNPKIPRRPAMGKRKSFVGTPCWMAPELIQGKQYDSSADIWSFGITALELTQGRAPRSRESPQKVLMRTIQEAPPTLDREGGTYKYSRAFEEIVENCLVKDASKRPTAEQLLQSSFFRGTKKKSYLVGSILKDLPPLAQRQERRVLPSAQTRSSIDSWDFATTVHSAGSSGWRRQLLIDAGMTIEGVFEMEVDVGLSSGRPSREASIIEEVPPDELLVDSSSSPDSESPIQLQSIPNRLTPPSSPALSQLDAKVTGGVMVPIPSQTQNLQHSPPSFAVSSSLSSAASTSITKSEQKSMWSKIKTAANRNRRPSSTSIRSRSKSSYATSQISM